MRILFVRLRLIGDVVFTAPLLRAVRHRFPDAHLAYLVEPLAADVVTANPHLDDVIVADAPGAPGRWRRDLALVRRLRDARYDVVVDLHAGPRAALFTLGAGAARRIGYRIAGRAWIYTDVVPRPSGLEPRHAVENQWDLMARLGAPETYPARDAVEMARERLGHAGAGRVTAASLPGVAEIRALAERAAVYIGGDSGPLHVASTTSTPIVALLGPTLAERSRPWRDPRWHTEAVDGGPLPCRPCHRRRCEPGDFRCLTRIGPGRVAAAERALAARPITMDTRA